METIDLIYKETDKEAMYRNTNLSKESTEKFKDLIIFLYVVDEGNISKICKGLLISRSLYYSWLKSDPDFKNRIEQRKVDLINKDYRVIELDWS